MPLQQRTFTRLGDVVSAPTSDGEWSYSTSMGTLYPGHFSISPDDHDDREMIAKVRSDSAGEELNVTFKATISMEMSAFEKLAKKKFKGVYWLSDEPCDAEGRPLDVAGRPKPQEDA